MPRAPELEQVAAGVFIWRFYDPAVKAELFSTGLETAAGLYLIDPIPLTADAMANIGSIGVGGIIVTNENHNRAAAEFAEKFDVPIFREGMTANLAFTIIALEGGPPGEIAIHSQEGNGTVIIGDALINFEPYGFALLPPKYCTDAKLMRRSLAQLLEHPFERMFFAHGLPILSGGRKRLELLLNERN